jgi:cyclophilin family peptidyl-prolyl cis-trans isomerase
MRKFFLFFLFPLTLFCQFTKNDEALIKTTFSKRYDRKIIIPYLRSDDLRQTRAALLSISSSGDTGFVPDVITADFIKAGDFIAFALGRLGQCKKSEEFLSQKVFSGNKLFFKECLEAFGRTASRQDFEKVVSAYRASPSNDWTGISSFLVAFSSGPNKTKETDSVSFAVLCSEFSDLRNSDERKTGALIAFYRIGGSPQYRAELNSLLTKQYSQNVAYKPYALAAIRRAGSFTCGNEILCSLFDDKGPITRIEAVKLAPLIKNTDRKFILQYIKLLSDSNPSVARQAAITVQNLKPDSLTRNMLKDSLLYLIKVPVLSANTKGELLKSICKLWSDDAEVLLDEYGKNLKEEFIIEITGENFLKITNAETRLYKAYDSGSLNGKILAAEIILSLNNSLLNKKRLTDFAAAGLSVKEPALVTVFAEGIKEWLIKENPGLYIKIIEKQIEENSANADFSESIIAIAEAARKISDEFFRKIINRLKDSPVYSIKKYALAAAGSNEEIEKDARKFEEIFDNSFAYSEAVIKTEKGEIEIKFLPEYAPVTTGNFCLLAQNGFYNGNTFHRVVPGFVIQAGDTTGTGYCGPGYEITTEPSPVPYTSGKAGFASAGKDTEGSQWFIMQGFNPHLNGNYSLFAEVIRGMEVALNTDQGDKIASVKLKK